MVLPILITIVEGLHNIRYTVRQTVKTIYCGMVSIYTKNCKNFNIKFSALPLLPGFTGTLKGPLIFDLGFTRQVGDVVRCELL